MYRKIFLSLLLFCLMPIQAKDAAGQSSILMQIEVCGDRINPYILEWSPDDRYFVCTSTEGAVFIDTMTYEVAAVYPHKRLNGVTFNRAGTQFITTGADGYIRLWNLGENEPVFEMLEGGGIPSGVWSPDEQYISTWSYRGTHVWNTRGRLVLETPLNGVVWHPYKNIFMTYQQSRSLEQVEIEIWDVEAAEFIAHWSSETQVFFYNGGPQWNSSGDLISVSIEQVIIFDADLNEIRRFDMLAKYSTWSAKGLLLVQTDGQYTVLDPYTGDMVLTVEDRRVDIGVIWHPDGERFAWWYGDDSVEIWNLTGRI